MNLLIKRFLGLTACGVESGIGPDGGPEITYDREQVNLADYIPDMEGVQAVSVVEETLVDVFLVEVPDGSRNEFVNYLLAMDLSGFEEVDRETYRSLQTEDELKLQFDFQENFFSVSMGTCGEKILLRTGDIMNQHEKHYLVGDAGALDVAGIAAEAEKYIGASAGTLQPGCDGGMVSLAEMIPGAAESDGLWAYAAEQNKLFMKHYHIAGDAAAGLLDYLLGIDLSGAEQVTDREAPGMHQAPVEIRLKCQENIFVIGFMEQNEHLCISVKNTSDEKEENAVILKLPQGTVTYQEVYDEVKRML